MSLPTYSVAQLANEFGLTPRTIRFFESEGLLRPDHVNGVRQYDETDRARIAWIVRGKRLGLSLAELKLLLDLYQADTTGRAHLVALLERSRAHRAELVRQRTVLDAQIVDFDTVEAHILAELEGVGRD
jgi:DNA-binding transcriptional MerR regulator